MSRVLVIGCGGVASVAIQKCCQAEKDQHRAGKKWIVSSAKVQPWIWGLPDRVPGADHEDVGLCKEDWSYDDRQLYDESDEVCDCDHRDQHRERKMPDLRL